MCLNHQLAQFSSAKADAFAERLVDSLNQGAVCLMTSIGHRTGLFDRLAEIGPTDSARLARSAGLNERYVREWLNALTVAAVVEYDPHNGVYTLPAEHAAYLTRAAAADNIAVFAQYIPVLATVEDAIIDCFHEGGDVPYERFDRFHEVMAEDSGQSVLSSLFDHILPLVPGLKERLAAGIEVLDLGCGRGRALHQLAQHYPHSQFVGIDLSQEAIDYARAQAQCSGLDNLHFLQQDLTHFDEDALADQFDLITTFDAIHDQAKPLAVLQGIHKSLRDDGVYLMQDIHGSSHVENNLDHPIGPLLYTLSTLHCMTVSLAQGGEGLGTLWGRETATALLHEAGFRHIEIHRLAHDFQNDYYVIGK